MSIVLKQIIEAAWDDRAMLGERRVREAVLEAVDLLDRGELRTAEPDGTGAWRVNQWVKKAVLLYFAVRPAERIEAGALEFYDKVPLKHDWERQGVRAVPGAIVRYGAYVAPGAVLMPSLVNIGARVGEGTMVDTWATVGSCAQIGRHVHLSGGVGIGGVLEPLQAAPVIVEDDCFIGSRCIVVEGARIGKGAVLGAGTVVTGSTKVIDVRGDDPVEYRGEIPARSVVIPGTYPRRYPAGEYGVPCALIVGERSVSTDSKVSLNEALRRFDVPV